MNPYRKSTLASWLSNSLSYSYSWFTEEDHDVASIEEEDAGQEENLLKALDLDEVESFERRTDSKEEEGGVNDTGQENLLSALDHEVESDEQRVDSDEDGKDDAVQQNLLLALDHEVDSFMLGVDSKEGGRDDDAAFSSTPLHYRGTKKQEETALNIARNIVKSLLKNDVKTKGELLANHNWLAHDSAENEALLSASAPTKKNPSGDDNARGLYLLGLISTVNCQFHSCPKFFNLSKTFLALLNQLKQIAARLCCPPTLKAAKSYPHSSQGIPMGSSSLSLGDKSAGANYTRLGAPLAVMEKQGGNLTEENLRWGFPNMSHCQGSPLTTCLVGVATGEEILNFNSFTQTNWRSRTGKYLCIESDAIYRDYYKGVHSDFNKSLLHRAAFGNLVFANADATSFTYFPKPIAVVMTSAPMIPHVFLSLAKTVLASSSVILFAAFYEQWSQNGFTDQRFQLFHVNVLKPKAPVKLKGAGGSNRTWRIVVMKNSEERLNFCKLFFFVVNLNHDGQKGPLIKSALKQAFLKVTAYTNTQEQIELNESLNFNSLKRSKKNRDTFEGMARGKESAWERVQLTLDVKQEKDEGDDDGGGSLE